MTSEQMLAYQRDWEARLAEQAPHPVYLPVRVRWDLPWDDRGAVVEIGARVAVDEARLDGDAAAARRDPWADTSFVIDSQFVQWPGYDLLITPDGVPMVPWAVDGPDGTTFRPLNNADAGAAGDGPGYRFSTLITPDGSARGTAPSSSKCAGCA